MCLTYVIDLKWTMKCTWPTKWNYMALMGNDLLAGTTATETSL